MKKITALTLLFSLFTSSAFAADYVVDGTDAGMHASVQFKASHMGISNLWGRFNDITGSFTYDKNDIASSSINISIDPSSLDSNHEARDVHLTSSDYLDTFNFPEVTFLSTSITDKGNGVMGVTGDFSFHGVTKTISFDVTRTGEGETPFGDYRVGFEGMTSIEFGEYGIPAMTVDIVIAIEGVRS